MTSLLENLNEAQREAVLHIDGPLLILAGPGSGKTRVVTHRVAHMLEQGIHARQILALTFTNKAASEMRNRIQSLVPGQPVWVSTFHRFGARMLREFGGLVGLAPNFTIYDTSDSRQVLKRVLEAEKIATVGYSPDRIAGAISAAKNKLITADDYQARRGSPLSEIVAKVYPAYQQRMLQSAAVDFDDLLVHVATLLYHNPEVRAQLDERFRYVLVDEYQDTNKAQYVILKALSLDHPNLAATGDPDQSIYGWRGADISNILEFERDFPQVRVVRLEQNYRSTKAILRIADELIAHNTRRKKKSLFTDNEEGRPVKLVAYADQDLEAAGIAEQIRGAIERGERRARDFAVFYRVNALSRSVERALRKAGVPYQMVRGQEFYGRKEVKDILAYCQLANNPQDDVAFERAVNSPTRGIGKKSIERLNEHAYRYGTSMLEAAREAKLIDGLPKRATVALLSFVALIDKVAAIAIGSVEEVVGTVIEESGYAVALRQSDDPEDQSRLENIEELLTDARQFDEQADEQSGAGLEAYLERTWLVNETDDLETDADKVTLMTLHATKGLEFPVVFLIAIEDGLLPHERSRDELDQLEEERRLAFVGITRAEDELQMSYVRLRDFRGQRRVAIPSSFLMEMPRHELEMTDARNEDIEFFVDEYESYDAHDEYVEPSIPIDDVPLPEPAKKQPKLPAEIAGAITTAAQLAGGLKPAVHPKVSPDVFALGMTVIHPEFGPGKITALGGSGTARKATVQFATAGERKFILAHSALRPAGG
ncbi:ATP-dependent helicase [Aeoliella sp. SH292]|uniref:ATP-dependent helicase n=1 Tax=Aeoliella sp. SH292 TaxID=3454464 RepID=UPI003F95A8DC